MSQSELAHLELLAEVDTLAERLGRWNGDAPDWRPAEKCKALIRRLVERVDSLRVRIDSPLVVATLGGSGVGKSALLNALLGDSLLRTGRSRPTTTRPTLICRPNLKPEMLGIDPATVELVHSDRPALRDLVLIDCPDPDTSEDNIEQSDVARGDSSHSGATAGSSSSEGDIPRVNTAGQASSGALIKHAAGGNLDRLRAILPQCDVLLVVATQQKYRSARVADELAAAARGARIVFVQTHADQDDDIRDDWRQVMEAEYASCSQAVETQLDRSPYCRHIYFIDSISSLNDAGAGRQPRGEFAELLDLLTRDMAGAAANRIRRANFLDLTAETLNFCRLRIEDSLPSVHDAQEAIDEQRVAFAQHIAERMQTELLSDRRQWENRLLGQAASRWGLSPFSLVLRLYQGLGGLISGGLLYRARSPAQLALWGAMEGTRTWRRWRGKRRAGQGADRAASDAWDSAELHKAAIIIDGYVAEAGLNRRASRTETIAAEAESAAAVFVGRASSDLESLIARLARRHTGWFTRWRYEIFLMAMLGLILYRLGKNFFYDSWLAASPQQVFGLDFYLSAGFWLVAWCLLLLWGFCSRLRRGLRAAVAGLTSEWQSPSSAAGLFATVEDECTEVDRYYQELEAMEAEVDRLRLNVRQS